MIPRTTAIAIIVNPNEPIASGRDAAPARATAGARAAELKSAPKQIYRHQHGKRRSEIKTLYLNSGARKRFKNLAAFLAALRERLGGRDPCNPADVAPQDFGHAAGLTWELRLAIEARERRIASSYFSGIDRTGRVLRRTRQSGS